MENFLRNCGLEEAIATFSEHTIELHQISELNENEMKELLPKIGQRLKLKEAIKRKHAEDDNIPNTTRKRTLKDSVAPPTLLSHTVPKSMNKKKQCGDESITKLIKTDNSLKEKLIKSLNDLVEKSFSELFSEVERYKPGWQWIDDKGLLHCPICRTLLTPQNRKDRSNFAWNVGNIKRHLDAHSSKCVSKDDPRDDGLDVVSMVEVIVGGNAEDTEVAFENLPINESSEGSDVTSMVIVGEKAEMASRKKSQGDNHLQMPANDTLLWSQTEDSCEASESESPKQDDDTEEAFESMKCNETVPVNGSSPNENIIRCICGMFINEGTIQCVKCLVCQHTECMGVDVTADNYSCERCDKRIVDLEIPLNEQTDDGHRYYLTLMRGDLQIHQADTVYVLRDIPITPDAESTSTQPVKKHTYKTIGKIEYTECDIFRVERLWKDHDGNRFVYGHHYLRPQETYHEPSRKFYENEVVRVPHYEVMPIDLVMGRCWVLDPTTFCKGRPVDCEESHVYVCELRVDKAARVFSKISKQQYPVCTKSYAFNKFEQKLKISRNYLNEEKTKCTIEEFAVYFLNFVRNQTEEYNKNCSSSCNTPRKVIGHTAERASNTKQSTSFANNNSTAQLKLLGPNNSDIVSSKTISRDLFSSTCDSPNDSTKSIKLKAPLKSADQIVSPPPNDGLLYSDFTGDLKTTLTPIPVHRLNSSVAHAFSTPSKNISSSTSTPSSFKQHCFSNRSGNSQSRNSTYNSRLSSNDSRSFDDNSSTGFDTSVSMRSSHDKSKDRRSANASGICLGDFLTPMSSKHSQKALKSFSSTERSSPTNASHDKDFPSFTPKGKPNRIALTSLPSSSVSATTTSSPLLLSTSQPHGTLTTTPKSNKID